VSNFFAIGTVTAALEYILAQQVTVAVPGAKVRNQRPAGGTFKPDMGVNLFCYSVVPNAAWRNMDLPTRSAAGDLVKVPQAAIDLLYLMTAYGDDNLLQPQLLIGAVVATLHTQPTLTKPVLDAVIAQANLAVNPVHPEIKNGDLNQQVELVRLCPLEMSTEELSKLWAVFESPYSLSVAYRASVVLLNESLTASPSLPVRSRGLLVSASGPPSIDRVASAAGPKVPITAASQVAISGSNLAGGTTAVRLASGDIAPDRATDQHVQVTLPAGLSAGTQPVQVVQQLYLGDPPVVHEGIASNLATFTLHPTVTAVAKGASVPAGGGNITVTVTVTVDIAIGPTQTLILLLSDPLSGHLRYMFRAPDRNAASPAPAFPITVLPSTYAVQVQVDGAESQQPNPPKVTLP
jgi:hypothetical protein